MSRPQRVKKTVQPPEPPRDPRLVALATQASRLEEWKTDWHLSSLTSWLRLHVGDIVVEVFTAEDGNLNCYANYTEHWTRPARTPVEALRAAYAALGVALDQAEDAFGGAS